MVKSFFRRYRQIIILAILILVALITLISLIAKNNESAEENLTVAQLSANIQQNEANSPELQNLMIPIYYDDSTSVWRKADSSNEGNVKWYDYEEKRWANAVTVSTNAYDNADVGTEILEKDILGYWVWIPRYAYSFDASSNTFNIAFLRSTSDVTGETKIGHGAYANYRVHPAFTANTSIGGWSEEITGFWVAKFEASDSETKQVADYTGKYVADASVSAEQSVEVIGIGTISDTCDNYGRAGGYPVFKPNVTSWRGVNVKDMELASKKVAKKHNIEADSHLMKNSEWGAVAYLTQSTYGNTNIWTNPYNEGELCWPNKEYIFHSFTAGTMTGMSGETRDAKSPYRSEKLSKRFTNGAIKISYNEMDSDFNVISQYTNTYYRYNSEIGVNASTTGNVYGIYDMSGGAWEYVAAYVKNTKNEYISEYFSDLDPKYVNVYTISDVDDGEIYSGASEKTGVLLEDMQFANSRMNTAKYGDAIAETYEIDGDHASFPGGAMSFFMRGGSAGFGDECGIFCYGCDDGGEFNTYGFRVVLVI